MVEEKKNLDNQEEETETLQDSKDALQEFNKEMKKRIEELNKTNQEVFILQDLAKGRLIQLHSCKFDANELATIGLKCFKRFFKAKDSKFPSYV